MEDQSNDKDKDWTKISQGKLEALRKSFKPLEKIVAEVMDKYFRENKPKEQTERK